MKELGIWREVGRKEEGGGFGVSQSFFGGGDGWRDACLVVLWPEGKVTLLLPHLSELQVFTPTSDS